MEDLGRALDVIRGAIESEIAGQRFYDDAARYCVDLWAKEMLSTLAREEEGHARLLLGEYDALQSDGRWLNPQDALQRGEQVDVRDLTFAGGESAVVLFPPDWSPEQVFDRTADDLSALAFGLQLEQLAITHYSREADAAMDAVAEEAYLFLAQEERRHYRQLSRQWERLSGEPWQKEEHGNS